MVDLRFWRGLSNLVLGEETRGARDAQSRIAPSRLGYHDICIWPNLILSHLSISISYLYLYISIFYIGPTDCEKSVVDQSNHRRLASATSRWRYHVTTPYVHVLEANYQLSVN